MMFFDVSYSSAVGDEVFGITIIEQFQSIFGIWTAFSEIQASSEPVSGSGKVEFDCGASSNFDSGQFRSRLVLRDDNGPLPEVVDNFPAPDC